MRDEGVGGGAGAHLRLVVVGGDVAGRVDQAALLPLPLLLAAAVEEVGDVRVLLGLGDVKLAAAGRGDDLGQGRLGARLGEGDGVGPALAVGGHRGQVEQRAAARELIEVRLGQGAGHLAGAVGTEVDEDRHVALVGAVVVADHRRLDELVGLLALIRLLDRLGGGRRMQAAGMDDRVVGELDPLPAGVAVHRVIAAADRGDTAGLAQPALELAEVAAAAVGQRVAAVGEGVKDDVGDALLRGELDRRLDVLPAGVDAAVGDEAEQVQAAARAAAGAVAGSQQRLVLEEAAVGDRVVDPGQVLLDDRAGAEVEMADLRVAHLPVGQADVAPLGGEFGVGELRPETIEDRRLGQRDRVAGAGRGKSPAVEDHQRQRRHRQLGHPAASTIWAKSSGSRLAPPTSAPSMSGCAISSAALPGLTEPP